MTQPALDPRVLSAYLAAHLDDARVLYVGDLDETAPFFDAGARLMQVYRVTPPHTPLEGAVLVQALDRGVDVAPGAFDLAIVEDLAGVSERLALLATLRAAVGTRGVAVVVARTGEGGVDYSELFDACSSLFEHVTMVGKVPFTGTLLCELGLDEAPEVSVDTDLAEHEAPTTLVAVLAQHPVELDPYAIFAHPAQAPAPAPTGPDSTTRTELSRLMLQNQLLQSQLAEEKEQRSKNADLATELEAAVLASKTAEAEALTLRNALVAALEQQHVHEAAMASQRQEWEDSLAAQRQELERSLVSQRQETERSLAAQRQALEGGWAVQRKEHEASLSAALAQQASAADLEKALAELASESERAERAEAQLSELQAELARTLSSIQEGENRARRLAAEWNTVDATRAEEVAAYEAALRERGVRVAELEAELVRRERMIKQLLIAEHFAKGRAATAPPGELEQKLDGMALEVARHRSELEARAWRIQELESVLGAAAHSDQQG